MTSYIVDYFRVKVYEGGRIIKCSPDFGTIVDANGDIIGNVVQSRLVSTRKEFTKDGVYAIVTKRYKDVCFVTLQLNPILIPRKLMVMIKKYICLYIFAPHGEFDNNYINQ